MGERYEFRVNFLNNESFPLVDTLHNFTTFQIATLLNRGNCVFFLF